MRPIAMHLLIMLITLCCGGKMIAQTPQIDSLENELRKPMTDSARLYLYFDIADRCYPYDTAKAWGFVQKEFDLVNKLGQDFFYGEYYHRKGGLKEMTASYAEADREFDSAVLAYTRAANKADRSLDERKTAKLSAATSKGSKAMSMLKSGKGKEAIELLLEVIDIWKASDHPRKVESIGTYYTHIATTYYDQGNFSRSLEYDKLCLANYISAGTKDEFVAFALLYVCDDFNALKQFDSSLVYLEKAKPIVEKINTHRLNIQYYNKFGQVNRLKENYKTAIFYYNKGLDEAIASNTLTQMSSNRKVIGICYVKLGDYAEARKYFTEALPIAMANNFMKDRMEILGQLVDVEEKTGHTPRAFAYLKELTQLKDSIKTEETKKAITEIENKYQAAEKSKEILSLQKDKQAQEFSIRNKSTLNKILIAALAAILLLGLLLYWNYRQKRQLQLQKIGELEKDKQLVAVDSMLKGQEEERSRLAKDLHDGLGGLLSGVKLSLSNMKDNLIVTPDNMVLFERSLDMIDTSIKELRRVAHNMMPEMLTRFGLDEALKEYCNNINSAKLLSVKYQSLGMEKRLDSSTEIIIYRVVQELLNNTIKHAAATESFVQLIREDSRLSIVIEDNGRGFDAAILENNKGAGWMSIRSRIEYLKGQLDIHTEPGKGTLVNIELKV